MSKPLARVTADRLATFLDDSILESYPCLNSDVTPAVSINLKVSAADYVTVTINGCCRF